MKQRLKYRWFDEMWVDEEGGSTLSLKMTEEQVNALIDVFETDPVVSGEDWEYIPIYWRNKIKVAVQVGRALAGFVGEQENA